jgi:type IV secretory pathway VirJ component
MKKAFIFSAFLLFIFFSDLQASMPTDSVNISHFGKVYVYKQAGTPENIAIMISGDGGWKYGVIDFSENFSKKNTLVIGVDILKYHHELRQRRDSCINVSADFVQLATEIEQIYNFPEYEPAVLMGYSSGATLVYAILSQSRPGTFIGGISLGFCPDIELPGKLCQINGLKAKIYLKGKSFMLQPDSKLGNPWVVLQGMKDNICGYSEVSDFVKKTRGAELITLSEVGHGFSKWSDFMPQWENAYNNLIAKYRKQQQNASGAEKIKNLPLIIVDAVTQSKEAPIALLISGDGGWYGFEQSIADYIAKLGISTIGLDSRKYFWNRKTPEETAADVAKALDYYGKVMNKNHFVLIGYSLGAELVPFVTNRLPQELRQKVDAQVLLSPERTTDFEVHFTNMLGMGNRQNTYNVIDEIRKAEVRTLLIFGSGEKSEVPGLLTGTPAISKFIPGDHHYKFDVDLIIKTIRDSKVF